MDIKEQIYALVRQIPPGKVATYGDVARVIGINPRYVGYVLHHNPSPGKIPCHRIVNAQGRVATTFAFGGGSAQQKLLETEGILFEKGRLNLSRYRHIL
jgi:methylated-DNA-protein-cysteine methyltransferase-like protein